MIERVPTNLLDYPKPVIIVNRKSKIENKQVIQVTYIDCKPPYPEGVVNKLGRFLKKRLSDYGKQLHFARETGFSPGTVTKWINGENTPNFENCLIIADYFDLDPGRVFKMAGKLDYYRLFQRLVKRAEFQAKLVERFQKLIDQGLEKDLEKALSRLEKELTDSDIEQEPGKK